MFSISDHISTGGLPKKNEHQHFGDLEGVQTDIDDILIRGPMEAKHDQHLQAVLQRWKHINLTLNKEK